MRCDVAKRTTRPKRVFSLEFKREASRLVRESDKSLTAIARELGIGAGLLSKWMRQIEAEEKTGLSSDELKELSELRKENARLKEEVVILGKATAFFASRKL
jgi:transposase